MRSRSVVSKVFLSVVVISLLLISANVLRLKAAFGSYKQSRLQYSEQLHSALRSVEDYDWLHSHRSFYEGLSEIGVIGMPDDLGWVDFLAPLDRQVSISDYQFEISPISEVELSKDLLLVNTDVDIYGKALHDGALISLLESITDSAPGAWFYHSLEVVRQQEFDVVMSALPDDDASKSVLEVVLKLTRVSMTRRDTGEARI